MFRLADDILEAQDKVTERPAEQQSRDDISFEEIGKMFGAAYEDIASIFAEKKEVADVIQEVRQIASDNDIDLGNALLVKMAGEDPNIDAALAKVVVEQVIDREIIPEPAILESEVELKGDDEHYELCTDLHQIADLLPDSLLAKALGCADAYEAQIMEKHAIEVVHEENVAELVRDGKTDQLDAETARYEEELAEFNAHRADIDAITQEVRDEIGKTSPIEVTDVERTLVRELVAAERGETDARGVNDVMRDILEHVDAHEGSALGAIAEARTEFEAAKEKITEESGQEGYVELLGKYRAYEQMCIDVLDGKVVFEKEADIDVQKDTTVEAGIVDEVVTNEAQETAVEEDPIQLTVEGPEKPETEQANADITKDGKAAVEPANGAEKPSVSARVDARAVLDYGVAERIYAQKEDYPAFNDGKDLVQSVYAKYDGMEKVAKEGGPMSRETCAIADELEKLGAKNGDEEHDARIDDLIAQKEDILLRAGAIIGSARTTLERQEDTAIYNFHRADMAYSHGDRDQVIIDQMDTFSDGIKEFSADTSPDRGGIAAQYNDLYIVRNNARIKAEALHEKYEQATTQEAKAAASDEQFEARYEQDKSQRAIDSMYFEIEICKDGIAKYGEIDTPPEADSKVAISGTDAEPIDATVREPVQSSYDIAKEAYNDIRDKYTFRNMFVSYDRLTLDIEAYKTGEDGSRGRPVSGGDIAMDFFELWRGDLWKSMVEVAVRSYLDEKFPAVEKVDIDADENHRFSIIHSDKDFVAEKDFAGYVDDRGIVSDDGRNAGVTSENQNPAYGRFAGADMTVESRYDDIGMRVYDCAPEKVDFTVTTGKVDADGKADVLNIPPIRLVEVGESRYLVDPFGQAISSNVITSAADRAENYDLIYPKFENLDISASADGKERIEALAVHKGISVEECKQEIVSRGIEKYVERGIENIQTHTDYIKEKLLPEALGDLAACKERIAFIGDVKEVFENRIEHPMAYDSPKEIGRFEKFSVFLDDIKGKLEHLEEKLTDRVEKLTGTLDMYQEVRDVVRISSSLDGKFDAIVRADTQAYGKIDNPYYGVDITDLRSVDTALGVCGYKGDTETLLERFDGRGWPEADKIAYEWHGAKVDMVPPDENALEMKEELREAVQEIYPDYADRWPGLIDRSDRNVFEVEKFDPRQIVMEAGIIQPDREQEMIEARKQDSVSEDAKLERLGMTQYIDTSRMSINELVEKQTIYLTPDKMPTKEQIEDTRREIKDFGYASGTANGFGARIVTPDFDWNTVRPEEILRDEDKDIFLVRLEGTQTYVEMTPQQASAYLHGPLGKEDVLMAFDKHMDISKNSANTYDFGRDFLETNLYRIDPQTILEAYAEKLNSFVGVGGAVKADETAQQIDTMADCLAALKDKIVEAYADAVSDKLEKIIGDAVDKGDETRVSIFIDKLSDSFENVMDRVAGQDIDLGKVQLSDAVVEKLDMLASKGIGAEDVSAIAEIAKALDAVFDGYSDMLKNVSAACAKNDVDTGVDKDDTDVAAEDDRDARTAGQDEEVADTDGVVKDVADSIENVLSGLDKLEDNDGEKAVELNAEDDSGDVEAANEDRED